MRRRTTRIERPCADAAFVAFCSRTDDEGHHSRILRLPIASRVLRRRRFRRALLAHVLRERREEDDDDDEDDDDGSEGEERKLMRLLAGRSDDASAARAPRVARPSTAETRVSPTL